MIEIGIAVLISGAMGSAPAAECDRAAIQAVHPALGKVLEAAATLRGAAAEHGASFSQLVTQAQGFVQLGADALGAVQEAGCRLEGAAAKAFENCLAPLIWSCESVPPAIDWSFLDRVKRTDDEELAFTLGDPALLGPQDLFATCCDDSGCVEGGIRIPSLFLDRQLVAKLARLSGFDTRFGRVALQTLQKSSAGLSRGSCSCGNLSADHLAGVIADLRSASKETRRPQAAAALRKMSVLLRKGLPESECAMPGGE